MSTVGMLCAMCWTLNKTELRIEEQPFEEADSLENSQRTPSDEQDKKKGKGQAKNGPKPKQPFQLFPPYKGKKTYQYATIGYMNSLHNPYNMSQTVSGAAEFVGADGSSMVSGSNLLFDTADIWREAPLTGFKLTSGVLYDRAYLLKLSLDLAKHEETYTTNGGNSSIQPIRISDPFLPQVNISISRAIKVLGAMAYAGINTSVGGYTMDVQDYTRPDTYAPKKDVQIFGKTYGRFNGTPLLHRRQLGVGLDMGAMLVAYPYSKDVWLGVEWNGTVGVTMRDMYLNNMLGVVFHFK